MAKLQMNWTGPLACRKEMIFPFLMGFAQVLFFCGCCCPQRISLKMTDSYTTVLLLNLLSPQGVWSGPGILPRQLHNKLKYQYSPQILAYATLWSRLDYVQFLKKSFTKVELIYKVVIISVVQQSDSVIHTHTSILFQILFPHRRLYAIWHHIFFSLSKKRDQEFLSWRSG